MAFPCFAAAQNYKFQSGETVITVGDDADDVLDALGKAQKVFEQNGSVYPGKEKVYTYPEFELSIFPDEICYRIGDVYLPETSAASTPEGLQIGSTKDDMTRIYGKNYTETGDACCYSKGDSRLLVYLSGNKVRGIEYQLVIE